MGKEVRLTLEERLQKAGIAPDEFADLVWKRIEKKVTKKIDDYGTKRERILAAVIGGLAARWSFGERECTSAQKLAEAAERLVDAVMLAESRREEEKRK
jgi:hypothetical protein